MNVPDDFSSTRFSLSRRIVIARPIRVSVHNDSRERVTNRDAGDWTAQPIGPRRDDACEPRTSGSERFYVVIELPATLGSGSSQWRRCRNS